MEQPTPPYEKAIRELRQLMEEAGRRGLPESTGATLATADRNGRPSARIVYILDVSGEGLVIFANQRSGKGQQMRENPHASLCFFWPGLQSQVIVEGEVELLSEADSDAYWGKRTRESQIGAWVSDPDVTAKSNQELKAKQAQYKAHYSFEQVPRPPDWRAFRIHPSRIEFWKTGWRRLLARTKYQRQSGRDWTEETENP